MPKLKTEGRKRMDNADFRLTNPGLPSIHPVSQPVLFVPERISFRGESETTPATVIWEWGRHRIVQEPISGCLRAFLKLSDESLDGKIVDFVRTWGPLSLGGVDDSIQPDGKRKWEYSDRVEDYRAYSRKANALLSIAADLWSKARDTDAKEKCSRLMEDWNNLYPGLVIPTDENTRCMESLRNLLANKERESVRSQRDLLAEVINDWIADSGVQVRLSWYDDMSPKLIMQLPDFPHSWDAEHRPDYPFSATDKRSSRPKMLLGLLAIQLSNILISPKGIYRCSVCGQVYSPLGRAPRFDRKRICSEDCWRKTRNEDQARWRNKNARG